MAANMDQTNYTTKILLSSIHCPSCVRTIDDTLKQFQDQVASVSTSTVTQTVTIVHSSDLSAEALAQALYNAGFDVQSMWEQHANQRISTFAASMLNPIMQQSSAGKRMSHAFSDFSCGLLQSPEQRRQHNAQHSANCEQCAKETTLDRPDSQTYLTHSGSVYEYDEKKLDEEVTIVVPETKAEQAYRIVLAIDGMTCSVCVGRIAEVLQAKPFVRNVNVNLLSNSATIIVDEPDKAAELVDEVEDIGYDAKLESCEPFAIDSDRRKSQAGCADTQTRNLMIKVEGYHCQHCPEQVLQALEAMQPHVNIVDAPKQNGLVSVSYEPQPPQFTVRHIIQQIEAADPAFSASVFTPPSLEERARSLQAKHRRHVAQRLGLSILVAVPTFIFGVVIMSLLSPNAPLRRYWMAPTVGQTPRVQWVLLPLATIVYLFAADIFHRRALKEVYMMWRLSSKIPILRRLYRFGSMDMLLSLGTSVAYIGSIVIVIMSSLQRDSSSMDTDTTTYFDAVVFLTMFLLCGRLLEAIGKAQTADAVTSLGQLRPSEALLMNAGNPSEKSATTSVPIDQLEAGDVVLIPAGGSPPCDGQISHGTTTVNESSLTGESRPVSKTVGDEVFAGTVNITNAMQVCVSGVGGMSLLDKIIDTVREGQSKRAPIERVADVLTGYFVPIIVLIALLDWIIWLSLGYTGAVPYVQPGTGGWVFWSLQFSIAVLVVACPCGIGLAAPTALFVGTGIAAKQGILVKGGGEAFQEASTLDCVVFDKTGTITDGGSPQITDYLFLDQDNDHQQALLNTLQSLESASSHPLARAVVGFCESRSERSNVDIEDIIETPGKGMMCTFSHAGGAHKLFIGNTAMAEQCGLELDSNTFERFQIWSHQGKTVMMVGTAPVESSVWSVKLMLAASDPIREEAPRVVAALAASCIEVWLLSGDNITTAKVVAQQVGIPPERVIAGVLPHEKADKIRYLQRRSVQTTRSWRKASATKQRLSVAMVGDGINDAPALAVADVAIAMGSGSDTAISTASFVLLSSDLESVLTLLKLSKAVLRRVKFNFGWALGYNMIMLPIAAGVLFPATSNGSHIRLDSVWASLAMALSSVSVVTSSLLLKTRLPLVGFRTG